MNLNFIRNLKNDIPKIKKEINEERKQELQKQGLSNVEIELANKLDAVEEFSIDRFEENIAVLENRETREIINIEKEKLPKDSKEGDIIKCINGKYFCDEIKTRKEKEKYNNLWE